LIKRLHFVTDPTWLGRIDEAIEATRAAPADARPTRTTLSTVLTLDDDEPPRHVAVVEEWFLDEAHLQRAGLPDESLRSAGTSVLADAVVLRGADWLERRWAEGGPRFKHMALAVRAAGLTPEEFSTRWRDHAGLARTGASSPPVPIPDDVKGMAYVQDHPRGGGAAAWPYDAVNEVYFDALDHLRRRIAWFDEHDVGRQPDDLFGPAWFLAVREEVRATSPA
jgi:hypothetical protein